nr:MAG TPA: hypothetical protein [Caudoviricetes sp.]
MWIEKNCMRFTTVQCTCRGWETIPVGRNKLYYI